MDVLMDPGVNVLGGLAQGFAQAALPTRMPTPWGAVLGMGAGGAMQGARNSQGLQRGAQEVEAGRMQNQLTASGLPLALAQNQAMTKAWNDPNLMGSIYGNGGAPYGNPATPGAVPAPDSLRVPSPTGPASTGAPPANDAGGGIGGATAAALASLPDDKTRNLVINAALAKGLPQEAWAPWIALLHNESSGNVNVADKKNTNGTVDAGIGQINSSNWGKYGLTEANVRDPATNLRASADIFGQNWKATGGHVGQSAAAYHTGQPTAPDSDYVGRATTRLAQWNYPGAAGGGAGGGAPTAENANAMADNYLAQAADLERRQGMAKMLKLPPPPGDPAALRTAASQYRELALAGPKAGAAAAATLPYEGPKAGAIAAATTPYDIAKDLAKQGLRQNADGTVSPIPGFSENSARAAGAKAGAEAAATQPFTIQTKLAESGFRMTDAGTIEPIPGGAADPAYVGAKAAAEAKAKVAPALQEKGFALTVNGGIVPIAGGPADPAYQARVAGSKAAAEVPAKLDVARMSPWILRGGGMRGDPMTSEIIKNPEFKEVQDANGNMIPGHMNPASPFDPPGTPGEFSPVLMPGGQPAISKLPPDVVQGREELVRGLFGKDTDAYVAANNTQGWLNQLNHASKVMNEAGSAYMTGPFAETRLGLMSHINDAGRTLGLKAPFDEHAISSSEEMRKATTTAGFELASHYEGHARQAAATIMNATSAVPGMANSPKGFTLVSNGVNEGAQVAKDIHEYNLARFHGEDPYGVASPAAKGSKSGAGLETAEADFIKKFPAEMYSNRAISTVTPFKIAATDQAAAMKEMEKYLPGTVVTLANGRQTMVPPRAGAPAIPVYMRDYVQPQGGARAP